MNERPMRLTVTQQEAPKKIYREENDSDEVGPPSARNAYTQKPTTNTTTTTKNTHRHSLETLRSTIK